MEKAAFDICFLFDKKIQRLRSELDNKNNEMNAKNNEMNAKNNQAIKAMGERFSLAAELHKTKESSRIILKYLNISINASSPVIARTIIEMVTQERVNAINSHIQKLMNIFREEKHLVSNKQLSYLDFQALSLFVLVVQFKHIRSYNTCKKQKLLAEAV